jgi:HPt (histidine-containing phosphotransfer) domain-containing protein
MPDNNVICQTTLASKRKDLENRGGSIDWLIDLFIEEMPNYLADLQKAISAGDGQALYLAAHKFKGSSSNLGAVGVIAVCKQLEQLGRAGNLEQAAQLMSNEMDKEIKLLTDALKELKK